MFYDNSLADDYCHPHVLAARFAGRAWAEREHDAADGAVGGEWYPLAVDALPLVEFSPTSDVEDQWERELELAEICNEAAKERWESL